MCWKTCGRRILDISVPKGVVMLLAMILFFMLVAYVSMLDFFLDIQIKISISGLFLVLYNSNIYINY